MDNIIKVQIPITFGLLRLKHHSEKLSFIYISNDVDTSFFIAALCIMVAIGNQSKEPSIEQGL